MQAAWAADDDKLTFILLDRALPDTLGAGGHGPLRQLRQDHQLLHLGGIHRVGPGTRPQAIS